MRTQFYLLLLEAQHPILEKLTFGIGKQLLKVIIIATLQYLTTTNCKLQAQQKIIIRKH